MDNLKKKEIYEKLGAVWFQKVVFKVEDLKFKFIDKFCPNIRDWYVNQCDKKANKLCSRDISLEEKNKIKYEYNLKKMRFKRELVEKKNRNYHFTMNNASSFKNYLLSNKRIHKNGMIWNFIWIGLCSCAIPFTSGLGLGLIISWLGYNVIALGINFQCVNLQNYNLCRFEERKEAFEKIEKRSRERDAKNFAKVGKTIYNKLCDRVETPESYEVVSSITTIQELEQLKKLALEVKGQRTKEASRVLVKK
ncbi:MAG: hypothetical protein IJN90_06575 [Bacilli bacterium]|nr:hypothetical protein [Bacilli bacterium]